MIGKSKITNRALRSRFKRWYSNSNPEEWYEASFRYQSALVPHTGQPEPYIPLIAHIGSEVSSFLLVSAIVPYFRSLMQGIVESRDQFLSLVDHLDIVDFYGAFQNFFDFGEHKSLLIFHVWPDGKGSFPGDQ